MRVAALTLPSLLNRCRATLLAFVADEYLRGSMPFPRFGFRYVLLTYLTIRPIGLERRNYFTFFTSCLNYDYGRGHYGPLCLTIQRSIVQDSQVWKPLASALILSTQRPSQDLGTDMDIPQTIKELFADSAKRSSVAHLFHFYPLLCELASIPQSPSYHLMQNGSRDSMRSVSNEKSVNRGSSAVVERDARHLAMECLKRIGREMGLSS